jgi:hypothetical protein
MMDEKKIEWNKDFYCGIFSLDCEYRISVGEGTSCPVDCEARSEPRKVIPGGRATT